MLFEADQLERARSQFEQVVGLGGDGKAVNGTLKGYARLGLALVLVRQQHTQEALQIARGIPPGASPVHVHEVADELTGSISHHLEQKRMTNTCDVIPLK